MQYKKKKSKILHCLKSTVHRTIIVFHILKNHYTTGISDSQPKGLENYNPEDCIVYFL